MHESLKNTIGYIEMASRHLAETKKSFSALLGWSFQDYGPDYASFDDGRMTGGFFASGKTAGVNGGAPLVVFYDPELEKMLGDFYIPRPPFSLSRARRRRVRRLVGQIVVVASTIAQRF